MCTWGSSSREQPVFGIYNKTIGPSKLKRPPNRTPAHDSSGAVLSELEQDLGGRVRKKTVHLYGNETLTRELRAPYRRHKVELLANEDLILVDVTANYGRFGLFKINSQMGYYGKRAQTIRAKDSTHIVFTVDGNLSRAQSELMESGAISRLLDVISPGTGEEINVSQRLVRVYLRRPSKDRVLAVIQAVIDLMPHAANAPAEFSSLPPKLRPLVPLLSKWAIDDDEERARKLNRCADSTRQKLVDSVIPLLPAIDEFLGAFGANPPEEACALGSLAQAALEAKSLLAVIPRERKRNE